MRSDLRLSPAHLARDSVATSHRTLGDLPSADAGDDTADITLECRGGNARRQA